MDHYLALLKREMREAMGCTEPAASALAGAKAAELLGSPVSTLEVTTSRDMVKNAMGVGLPNCSLKGIQAAVALGACGGDAQAGLSILSVLNDEQIQCASSMPVALTLAHDIPPLYIRVKAFGSEGRSAVAVISGEHDRFSYLEKNGAVLLDLPVDACGSTLESEDEQFIGTVSLSEILAWVDGAPHEALELARWARKTNMAIAEHGMSHPYGLSVGMVAAQGIGGVGTLQEAFAQGSAMAAAASDARMAGCPLAVVINSGSGNQGITLTVPLAVVGSFLGVGDDALHRSMLVAQLVGLSLTARKNRLSALCGAFTAAIGTACGYVHLLGGGVEEMDRAFNTMVGNLTGIICDGAKGTCALKIHSCADAAALAAKLAMHGLSPSSESGIVGKSSSESRDFLERISREGMEEIDKTILSIMMGKACMNYVALDFETANEYAGGACSVALARFDEEGTLLESYYSLIRPKNPYFDPSMSAVHQLDSAECLASGEFDTIWPDMVRFIGRDIVVAHNAAFDMGVLKASLEAYDLQCDGISYLCTLVIARKVWPKMLSYKLSYIVDSLELEYRAHYALDDAIMCGKIFAKLCRGQLNDLLTLRRFLIHHGIEVKTIDHQRRGGDLFL